MDKGLKYKEAIDYLDTLNLKLPSELKEMHIGEIRENQLQKAEDNLNKKPYGFIDGPFIPQDTQSKKSEYIESA